MEQRRFGQYLVSYLAADGRRMNRVVDISDIRPSGISFTLTGMDEDGGELRLVCSRIQSCTDTETGEAISSAEAFDYFRNKWWTWLAAKYGGVPLDCAIDSIPAEDVGAARARLLAKAFLEWDKFVGVLRGAVAEAAALPKLVPVYLPGQKGPEMRALMAPAGPIAASSLIAAAKSTDLQQFVQGYTVLVYGNEPARETAISGLTIVFTGEIDGMDRADARNLAEACGARVVTAVSAAVDLVVAGAEPGPAKMQAAKKLGIHVVSAADFLAHAKENT